MDQSQTTTVSDSRSDSVRRTIHLLSVDAVSLDTLLAGKKVILFGVPGAFTPGCSKTHLPGYVADYEKLKQKNVDEIICTSVNDAFVMDAWGKDQHATGKVRMLADPNAELAKALGVTVDLKALGGIRSKRYSAIIENGVSVRHT